MRLTTVHRDEFYYRQGDALAASGAGPVTGSVGDNSIIGLGADGSQHVFYANADGRVHEIVHTAGAWYYRTR